MTPENVAECMDFSKLDGLEMKDGQITAAAAESEDEPELSVSEVWRKSDGKSFYKDDETGKYYDYQGDGEEVEAFEEGEKPKETKKKFKSKGK